MTLDYGQGQDSQSRPILMQDVPQVAPFLATKLGIPQAKVETALTEWFHQPTSSTPQGSSQR